MANMSKLIYKLQLALKQKHIRIYINTYQFYSEQQDRYIKMYIVKNDKNKILETSSQIKVIQALNALYQEVNNDTGDR